MSDIAVEEIDRVAPHPFTLARCVIRHGRIRRRIPRFSIVYWLVGERAAKICDRARAYRPTFFSDQVTHVGPRVERMMKARNCGLPLRPSERRHVLAHPDLKRLRGDRTHVGDEVAP